MSGSVCLRILQQRSPASVCAHIPSKGTGICGQLDLEIADTRHWIAGRRILIVVGVVVDPRRGATWTEPFGETGRSMADACHDDVGAMPVLGGRHTRCTSWQRTDRDAMTKRVPECTTDRRTRGTGTGSACSVSSTRVIGPMTRWARGVMSTGWRCRAAPVPAGRSGSSSTAIVEGSSATRMHHDTRGAFGGACPIHIDSMQHFDAVRCRSGRRVRRLTGAAFSS